MDGWMNECSSAVEHSLTLEVDLWVDGNLVPMSRPLYLNLTRKLNQPQFPTPSQVWYEVFRLHNISRELSNQTTAASTTSTMEEDSDVSSSSPSSPSSESPSPLAGSTGGVMNGSTASDGVDGDSNSVTLPEIFRKPELGISDALWDALEDAWVAPQLCSSCFAIRKPQSDVAAEDEDGDGDGDGDHHPPHPSPSPPPLKRNPSNRPTRILREQFDFGNPIGVVGRIPRPTRRDYCALDCDGVWHGVSRLTDCGSCWTPEIPNIRIDPVHADDIFGDGGEGSKDSDGMKSMGKGGGGDGGNRGRNRKRGRKHGRGGEEVSLGESS